jgi:hypothetical protein
MPSLFFSFFALEWDNLFINNYLFLIFNYIVRNFINYIFFIFYLTQMIIGGFH